MSRKVILHEDALRDLDETSAYIGETSPRASIRFLEAANRAFSQLVRMPGQGAPRIFENPALIGLRMLPVPGFRKYGIYYLTTPETVEILRVVHGSRDLDAIFGASEEDTQS